MANGRRGETTVERNHGYGDEGAERACRLWLAAAILNAHGAALRGRTSAELVYLEAKFAGLISCGLSARLLVEVQPLGRRLDASEVRRHNRDPANDKAAGSFDATFD